MDEKVQRKLIGMGYEPRTIDRVVLGNLPDYLVSLGCEGTTYYKGLLLFDGLVHFRSAGTTMILFSEQMTIASSKINPHSLHLNALERKYREEGIQLKGITKDTITLTGIFRSQHRTMCSLEIDYPRDHKTCLEFWLADEMWYVPRRT